MLDGLKPYPEYKDSGCRWVGKVPAHWEVRRAKYFFREIDERSTTGQEELLSVSHKTGVTPRSQKNVTMFMAESLIGYKLCAPGDVAINTMWAWMAALGVVKQPGIVSPSYGVYRPHRTTHFEIRFLDELLRTPGYRAEYYVRSTGITSSRLRLYPENFLRIPLLCPPPDEQAAIVRFLAHADRLIRRYIRAKRALVKLLEEQKQAIIHRAVTRGLDPSVRLKPSGVDWVGDVPEHWEVVRLGNLVEVRLSNVDKHSRDDEIHVRLCNYTDVYKNDKITDQISFLKGTAKPDEIRKFRLQRGDVLITKDSETWDDIAVPALVEWTADDLVCGYHLALLRSRRTLKGPYLLRALQSQAVARQFYISANGVTRYGLSRQAIKDVMVPVPSLEEQEAIARSLDEATRDVTNAISRARNEIELLREYRTRLVADVVTGKLDVRAAAAALPDVPGDDAEDIDVSALDDEVDLEDDEVSDDEDIEREVTHEG